MTENEPYFNCGWRYYRLSSTHEASLLRRYGSIYEHAGFGGKSAYLLGDEADLAGFKGRCEHYHSNAPGTGYCYTYDWNDCVSSIKVTPGWRATVYVDAGFHEDWLDVTADVPDLGQVRGYCDKDTWSDCISSIRVRRH